MKILRTLPWIWMLALSAAAITMPAWAEDAPKAAVAPRPKAKKRSQPKKRDYDYDKSKYKAYRALTAEETHSYKFDEKGKPIMPKTKKEPAQKKKSKPRPPEEAPAAAPAKSNNMETAPAQTPAK